MRHVRFRLPSSNIMVQQEAVRQKLMDRVLKGKVRHARKILKKVANDSGEDSLG